MQKALNSIPSTFLILYLVDLKTPFEKQVLIVLRNVLLARDTLSPTFDMFLLKFDNTAFESVFQFLINLVRPTLIFLS